MPTKTTLRAEVRSRRHARRAENPTPEALQLPPVSHSPIPVRNRGEAEGIARQIRAVASSMGGVSMPALFVPTPLEPDMSLAFDLFDHALLPIVLDEAGTPLAAPRWGVWEAGQALVTLGRPPAQPAGIALGAQSLGEADLIIIPALAASRDGSRLGQGGGWYDRALLHRAPTARIAAVVFDDEVIENGEIVTESHDIPVDSIITPTRTIVTDAR